MDTLSTRKQSAGLTVFLFAAAVLAAFAFSACETGGDPDSTIPLAGPRSIQVTARDGTLVLQWTKVALAQGIVPSYEVYYGTTAAAGSAQKWGEIQSGASNLVQSEITGLTNHVTYYVWVKAIYAGLGQSDFSPTTYGTPIPPPVTPGTLTVTAGEGMLEVTWAKVEDAFTYEVYYKAGASGNAPPAEAALLTVSEPGVVIPKLTNATAYTIWVRARNTAGDSPAYSRNTGTPVAAREAPTTAPGNLKAEPGDGKLTLTWDQVPGVPGYKIYYGTADNFSGATVFSQTIPAAAPSVSAELTGLANGTLYYVWVLSSNSVGTSSPGESVSGTPQAKDPITFSDLRFELGKTTAEYIFAQDLAPSVFFPEGRPNTDRLTRVQETALGNLFTDGAAWYIRKKYPEEDIDFVFLNGGYIDNALPEGTVTTGSVSAIVQPDSRRDKFILLTLTGAELKKFFNDAEAKEKNIEPGDVSGVVHTGRGGPSNTGFFGIVSKEVRYTLKYYKAPALANPPVEISYDDSEPYYHGFIDTANGLTINGAPIDDNKNYRICTTDYLASGEYFVLLQTAGKDKKIIDTPFWHGVAEYIYDQGRVTPYLDGRIKVEGGVPLPAPWVPGDLIKP
jgi:hypothetical protein